MARKGKRLVGPVDLEIDGSGVIVVVGPNGSGKTSLLRLMHGLERADGGTVTWSMPDAEARQRQAFVFQTPIMMRRRVVDCIAYPLVVHGTPRTVARTNAAEWAERIGLGDVLDCQASVLSGGERQKLALARALIRSPEVLFLDEPCANLDGRATREIEAILGDTRRSGTQIVMATHDMGQARRFADTVVFLLKGRLHEMGNAGSFFAEPSTAEAAAFLKGDILE